MVQMLASEKVHSREVTLIQEGHKLRRNEDSPSASIGVSLKKMKFRMMIGLNKLRRKRRGLPHMTNNEESFKSSFDSGLGSDLSSVKEQFIHTIYAESSTPSTPSSISTSSTPSTPSSILRSAQTSPLFKKKISFYEPAIIENTRKRCKVVNRRKCRPQPGCTLCCCGRQFCVKIYLTANNHYR